MNETVPTWVEVRVLVPIGWHELVADALAFEPCTSVVFGRTSVGMQPAPEGFDIVRTYFPQRLDEPELRERIGARVRELGTSTGDPDLADLQAQFRELPPEDFATSWKKTWKPFRVGLICVLPPWKAYELRQGERRLTLVPGGVFGSGRHATTRTCLRFLQKRVQPGARVIDAGTGSGILSVASALLGAGQVFGFDLDANSESAATALARDNGVDSTCTFRTGGFELLSEGPERADGILANIYADVVQAHADELVRSLAPGGWLIASGCLDVHADATRRALQNAGLTIDDELCRGRWVTFAGTRTTS